MTIFVLTMAHAEGGNSYYRVPEHWVEWIRRVSNIPKKPAEVFRPQPPMPPDLIDALIQEYGNAATCGFALRTMQVFAVDCNWLGTRLGDLAPIFATAEEIVDLYGTSY